MTTSSAEPRIVTMRRKFHQDVCGSAIYWRVHPGTDRFYSIADVGSPISIALARGMIELMDQEVGSREIKGQTAGRNFEIAVKSFIEQGLASLQHLRPGHWRFSLQGNISMFSQYKHLAYLKELTDKDKQLQAVLADYLVKPDIVVSRVPVTDDEINATADAVPLVGRDTVPMHSTLRRANVEQVSTTQGDSTGRRGKTKESSSFVSVPDVLHASISCKLTFRSDRAQNSRTEGLNLIRNRKGHTPHIAVVTAEPLPTRIASLALGTGDIDCVYHVALHELQEAVHSCGSDVLTELLETMVKGDRLRDISDLPMDLAA